MMPKEAKAIIKELGLTGVGFADLMGKSRNYVSDFNSDGVPQNIAIILTLCIELKNCGEEPIEIIKKSRYC